MSIAIALGGLIVGLLIGLVGVGGGSLVTPILVLLGIPASTAVGTDLFYGSGTKLVGAVQHWRLKSVNLRWVAAICVGGVPGAVIGSLLAGAMLAQFPGGEATLKHILGFALVLAALATSVQEWLRQRRPATPQPSLPQGDANPPWPYALPFGALIGFMVGLTSVGSGSLVAPAMLFAGLAPRRVVGTDIASALLITVAASTVHMAVGTVDYRLAFNLMLGSIPGVVIGSRLTVRVPGHPLKFLVSALVLVTGLRLIPW